MQPSLTPTESLAHSTVRIVVKQKNGNEATGTGFFFSFCRTEDTHVPVIVTNKHVVEGAITGGFNLTLESAEGGPTSSHQQIILTDFPHLWIPHPDPNVDLTVMRLGPLLRQTQSQGLQFFFVPLSQDLIATSSDLAELSPAEDLLMVGYPNGIWDEVNNLPIFRRGIAATHPGKCYNGKPEFIIDAACFPGSSGSPIFLYNSGFWRNKSGNTMTGGIRVKLLGILYAGPVREQEGHIKVVPIPTINVPIPVTPTMINLGFAVRAEKLLDFEAILKI